MITLICKFRKSGKEIKVSANNSPNLLALALADAANSGIPYHEVGYPTLTTVRQAMQDAANMWDGLPGSKPVIMRRADFEILIARQAEQRPAALQGEAR
jgi:hypothetical protein